MTSNEALEKLSYIRIYEEDEHNVITDIDSCCIYKGDLCEVYGSEVDTIKKDLEVLEILKRKSVDISLIKDIMLDKIKFDYYPYDNLTNEEFNKIKEWLENDK